MEEIDVPSVSTKLQNTLIQYHSIPDDTWSVAKKSSDVTVWRKPSEEFGGCLYKVEGVVKDVTNRIVDYIRPGPYRLQWDSLMTTMDIIKDYQQGCCVMSYTTAGQLLNIISPREFIDFSYTTKYEDGLLTCGVSIEYEAVRPHCVRGFNHPCGWFCVPLQNNPEHSFLTGYIQTDLRGMLPQSTVDFAMAGSLVNFYSDLRKALTKS
ncbi:stAR-related lipid transfer protein 4 [Bufo bufo]|uniref:stAR-related lipid transfer protein 4 n=1 Tax=Bufo bufo TaxID=8384 RepID=UPI001ABDC9EB|nr:stAR-related lipid transfer protein 4 [Bufo bufo]XP_040277553.1 stAR-related lipid transfer protein 4 [Bufo bufo]